MTEHFTGPPPVRLELNRVMHAIASGETADDVESELVDVKEEPGRRGRRGEILPGGTTNEEAATYLAGELACLANSGGGALVLGVADSGEVIGTALDVDQPDTGPRCPRGAGQWYDPPRLADGGRHRS